MTPEEAARELYNRFGDGALDIVRLATIATQTPSGDPADAVFGSDSHTLRLLGDALAKQREENG